ncbi:Hypothetical predicted protein [Olea europaea subsp. europaea]|uniref:Uncharacterized protein n=1 Tax=Olea europaea subsp. europaea TaxID=158383 RepID=A0A8S0UQX3_OLEEU|nr:Hypothetical predicted protein [Olea europaea subsp. europaea]
MKMMNRDQSVKQREIRLQRGTTDPPISLFLWITFFSASSSVSSSSFSSKWSVFNPERAMIWSTGFKFKSSTVLQAWHGQIQKLQM